MEPHVKERLDRLRSEAPPIAVTLISNESSEPKRTVIVRPGKPVLIGRASKSEKAVLKPSESNAFFECPVISRRHAELDACGGALSLIELGSMHGTYVNGVKLQKDCRTFLKDGDEIQLGTEISRGEDSYHGMIVTVSFDASSSPDLASGSRTFTVPTVLTDDEEDDSQDDECEELYEEDIENDYDSNHSSEYSDILASTDIDVSSPNTSSTSHHDAIGSSPQKPITIDELAPQPVEETRTFAAVEHTEGEASCTSSKKENKNDGVDIRRFLQPAFDFDAFLDPPPSLCRAIRPPFPTFGMPATSDFTTLPPIDDPYDKLERLLEPSDTARSPSKMAIPNMLAPAAETIPAARPSATAAAPVTVADPFQTVLGEFDALLAQSFPNKQQRCKPGSSLKRKLDEMDEVHAPSELNDDASEAADEIERAITNAHPSKRRRTTISACSVAAHVLSETAKYSFGAAVGAMGTFAFLASPLGGRFADWLSTI